MKPLSVARVQYFDHQFLRPQDLTDEQAYHLSMRRRHNIGGHSWGIVSGLQLEVVDGGLYLRPGVAIDGLARELVVPERLELLVDGFVQQRTDVLEAWLEYALVDADAVRSAWRSCGDATPRYDRIIEHPLV